MGKIRKELSTAVSCMAWIDFDISASAAARKYAKKKESLLLLVVRGTRQSLLRPETRARGPEIHPQPCHTAVKTLPPVPSRYVATKRKPKRRRKHAKVRINIEDVDDDFKPIDRVEEEDLVDKKDLEREVKSVVADGSIQGVPRALRTGGRATKPLIVHIERKQGGGSHKASEEEKEESKIENLGPPPQREKKTQGRPQLAPRDDQASRLELVSKVHKFQRMTSKFVEAEREKKRKGDQIIRKVLEKMKPEGKKNSESKKNPVDAGKQDAKKTEVIQQPGTPRKPKPKARQSFKSRFEEAMEEMCRHNEGGQRVLECRDRMRSKGVNAQLHILCQGLLTPTEYNQILSQAQREISENSADIDQYKRLIAK